MVSVNPKTAALVLLIIGTLTVFLLKFFMKQTYGALKQDCRGVNNKNHAAERWDLDLVKPHRKYFQTPQKIIYQNSYHMLSFCTVIGLDLESHSHSREKVQFFETRSRIIFLAFTWRDESEIII